MLSMRLKQSQLHRSKSFFQDYALLTDMALDPARFRSGPSDRGESDRELSISLCEPTRSALRIGSARINRLNVTFKSIVEGL